VTEIQQFFPLAYINGWYSPRFPLKIHCVGAVTALWAGLSSRERLLLGRLSLTPAMFNDLAVLSRNLFNHHGLDLRDLARVIGLVKRFGMVRNGGCSNDLVSDYPEYSEAAGDAGLSFAGYDSNLVVAAALQKIITSHKTEKGRYSPEKCVQLVLYAVQQFG